MRFDPSGDVPFQLAEILNDGIEFGDNIRGGFVEFETTGAEQALQHNLGHIPIGWIVIYKDGDVRLWKGTSSWTNDLLYLVSNVPNVTVRIFVM